MQQRIPENNHKRYVSVIVCYTSGTDQSHAQIIRLQFSDGTVWTVDKTRRGFWAAAQKAGGKGMLYPILATPKALSYRESMGRQREFNLFHDGPDWFVELEDPE